MKVKDFYVIFKMSPAQANELIPQGCVFYRIVIKAISFGEAERKFNKQTSNKFGRINCRIITEIRMK